MFEVPENRGVFGSPFGSKLKIISFFTSRNIIKTIVYLFHIFFINPLVAEWWSIFLSAETAYEWSQVSADGYGTWVGYIVY